MANVTIEAPTGFGDVGHVLADVLAECEMDADVVVTPATRSPFIDFLIFVSDHAGGAVIGALTASAVRRVASQLRSRRRANARLARIIVLDENGTALGEYQLPTDSSSLTD